MLPAAFQFRFLEHHRLTDFLHETDNVVCWPHPCVRRPGGPPREIAVCCIVEIQLRSTALPRSLPPSSPAHVRGITVAIRILSAVARILLRGLVNMEDGVRHVHGERHLSALQRKIVNLHLC